MEPNKICNECLHRGVCKYNPDALEFQKEVDKIKSPPAHDIFVVKINCARYQKPMIVERKEPCTI